MATSTTDSPLSSKERDVYILRVCAEQLENYSFHEYGKELRRIADGLGSVVETKAPQVPAAHRAGTEPLSRLAGDVEWCLASINPDSDVYAVLHGVQVALRGHKTNGITIELKACDARRLLEDIKSDYPFKVGSQLAVLRDHLEASFAEKTSRQLAGSAADASGPVNQCTFPQETPANAMLKRVAQKPNGCRLCGHEHNLPPCPDETLDRSKPDLSQNGTGDV